MLFKQVIKLSQAALNLAYGRLFLAPIFGIVLLIGDARQWWMHREQWKLVFLGRGVFFGLAIGLAFLIMASVYPGNVDSAGARRFICLAAFGPCARPWWQQRCLFVAPAARFRRRASIRLGCCGSRLRCCWLWLFGRLLRAIKAAPLSQIDQINRSDANSPPTASRR